ncbi:hypothetical protein DOTSEDRAFT_73465 [Dothistroma septosporum NZE10]|uniref:peptidylprolyl isomerase n=1 Tax=Dothistroma septosporum (strain NZE10 / CBS 128990) TaxID=675120 RepID=N1PMF6_DOTSN|nr:hypothetical protein DOTSEDRAFT_73465 [Dothistroma septosporum NZE10]
MIRNPINMRSSFGALPSALILFIASATSQTTETLPNGLIIEHTSGPVVCDRPTRVHDKVAMHYKGALQSDGKEFDQSYKRGKPFEFTLGEHEVIDGWDLGLVGMCIGQSRKLTIPPALGYGNMDSPRIPANSVLVFETKLMDIVKEGSGPVSDAEKKMMQLEGTQTAEGAFSIATAPPTPEADAKDAGEDDQGIIPPPPPDGVPPEQTRCHLLGPFALMVQGLLGAFALLTLVFKRWRETPKRPWKIFFFDVSKQVFGSMLTHVINLAMSELGSVDMANAAAAVATKTKEKHPSQPSPNPCSFYLLNLGIDTTIGVPVLYFILKALYHLFLRTPLANPPESIKSGHYGSPAKVQWYLKQLLIYCIGLTFMKLFVFFLFLAMPFLPWIGDWALRWTEGNEALQIAFALFIFPLAMNAVQYWVIDNFIMDKKKGEDTKGYSQVADDEDERERMIGDDETVVAEDARGKGSEDGESGKGLVVKEIEPLPIPSYPERRGEGSQRTSPKRSD